MSCRNKLSQQKYIFYFSNLTWNKISVFLLILIPNLSVDKHKNCTGSMEIIYIMVVKFRNTIWPPPPQLCLHRRAAAFIGELRCQAIQMEHRPYIAERTQKAVYIVRCLRSQRNREIITLQKVA
jgi:hypothetical protein